jgi:hypothetical protein
LKNDVIPWKRNNSNYILDPRFEGRVPGKSGAPAFDEVMEEKEEILKLVLDSFFLMFLLCSMNRRRS